MAAAKIATLLFGEGDLPLRLVPLLAGLCALVLFWRVAERTLEGPAVPVSLALFAVAIPLIRYTGEAKQCSLDVAAALALTALALER